MQPSEILKESEKEFDERYKDYLKIAYNNKGQSITDDLKSHLISLTIKLLEGITEKLNTIKDCEFTDTYLIAYIQSLESQLSEIRNTNDN